MRGVDYTLKWLDKRWLEEKKPDEPIKSLWLQVQEARDARDDDKAISLCLRFLKRTDSNPDHAVLGLAYCYLAETYRLMGIHRWREAADAFGNARLHFALDSRPVISGRNKGVAYWSLAIVHDDGSPDEWISALRYYQSASRSIEETLKSARENNLDEQAKELEAIRHLIEEDHDALQWQQAAGDPKVEALANTLVSTEARLQELAERGEQLLAEVASLSKQISEISETTTRVLEASEKTAQESSGAAAQALYAARAAGNTQKAADSTSRKISNAAETTIQASIKAAEQLQHAAQQAAVASRADDGTMTRIEAAMGRLERATDQLQTLPPPSERPSLLIVPAALTTAVQPGDYFAVQGNGNDRETILEGEYEWIAESEEGPIYHFRRINNQILLVPVEQGREEERSVQLPGQIVGVLRKVS